MSQRLDRCNPSGGSRARPLGPRSLCLAAGLCLGMLGGARPAVARAALDAFYTDNDNLCTPHPKLQVTSEHAGDATVFTDSGIQMPAILAVLNYELSTNTWPNLSSGFLLTPGINPFSGPGVIFGVPTTSNIQAAVLQILNDPTLTFNYTGKQSTLAHSSGLQTIDTNTILINQEGLFDKGVPLPYYTIGQHVIHELGHVFQQRNWNWILPHVADGQKEVLPLQLEAGLSPDNFTPTQIARMAKYLKNRRSIEGTWNSNFGDVTLQYDPSTPFTGDKPVSVNGYWYQDNDQSQQGTLTGGQYDPATGRLTGFSYTLNGDSGAAYFQLSCGGQNMRGACGAPWQCWRDVTFPP